MTVHTNRNFSGQTPPCQDGDEFVSCNLSQYVPASDIFAGRTGMTFRRCNLVNVLIPDGCTVESCNTTQVSRCSWLHPEWVERGLPECQEDCSHVVEVTEITVDDVVVATDRRREDTVL